jgi:hypothetical protein
MAGFASCSWKMWICRGGLCLLPLLAASSRPSYAGTIIETFEDDFLAGRAVPDTVVAALSTPFSQINEKRPAASGYLTLRDRLIETPGGLGGGFAPIDGWVALDFTDGYGSYVTFRIDGDNGGLIPPGSFASFTAAGFCGAAGQLSKFVSKDGVNFQQVGDDSDACGHYIFPLPTGGTSAYFRLQVGDRSIYDGIWINDVVLYTTPEPASVSVVGTTLLLGWWALLAARRRRV